MQTERPPAARRGIVLSLCDLTGNMVRPWAEAGFECWCVDLQHRDTPPASDADQKWRGIQRIGADLRYWIPPPCRYAMIFAFPPCTHLAVSGARWFASKGLRSLIEGLEVVERCRNICETAGAPWM